MLVIIKISQNILTDFVKIFFRYCLVDLIEAEKLCYENSLHATNSIMLNLYDDIIKLMLWNSMTTHVLCISGYIIFLCI